MQNFIAITDYDASIHREILDAVTREDQSIIEICEDRALAEMRCYLSGRYDCEQIFTQEGTTRHQLILMMALDISIYHIFCIHNPQKLSQMRKDRYDRAVEWLKAVQKGNIVITGAPAIADPQQRSFEYITTSNPKRQY